MAFISPGRLVRDIQLGIKNLLLHKLRSFLTMLCLVFGVGSVIAKLAVGEGASEKALEQIRKLGSRNIIVTGMKPVDEQGASNVRTMISIYGLLYSDQARIAETIHTIRRMVPVKSMQKSARLGQRELDLRIVGTNGDWFELVRRPLLAGRVIVKSDVDEKCNVVVLTEHGARRLLATEACIGEMLHLGSNYYEVRRLTSRRTPISQSPSPRSTSATISRRTSRAPASANLWNFTRSSSKSIRRSMSRRQPTQWSGC